MRDTAAPEQKALHALLRVIASRDCETTSRLLAESPTLARLAVKVGATRQAAGAYFLEEIGHYVYAGDTPLHIAAAADARDVAEQLVASGANVRARNRRGAEPIHYASEGSPNSMAWQPN